MDFFDLKAQYQEIKQEIDDAVLGVLEKGVYIGGEEVEKFEKRAAEFIGAKHAITLNSGTDALYLSLKALNIGPGDEVITTPFTFFATAEAVATVGSKPVFVDIDPGTFNIDAAKIEAAITKNTKAIIPVHIFGQMADMAAIQEIAKKHNLKVVEDCAQSIGAKQEINGKKIKSGMFGDIGCFSFFPTKNLGAYGDGGMAITDSDELAARIRALKSHGSSAENKYKNLVVGVNSRLDAIQAAILNVKIKYLEQWNCKRAVIADYYNVRLGGVGDIATPFVAPRNNHIYHQYTIRTLKRDQLSSALKRSGIPTMVYYPIPVHLQPAFEYLCYKVGDLAEAERATREVLDLPIYPELERETQDRVIAAIKEFYG